MDVVRTRATCPQLVTGEMGDEVRRMGAAAELVRKKIIVCGGRSNVGVSTKYSNGFWTIKYLHLFGKMSFNVQSFNVFLKI